MDKEDIIRSRLEFFLENKIPVHLRLKNGLNIRGKLLEQSKENRNLFWIKEVKFGKTKIEVSEIFKEPTKLRERDGS